MSKVRLSIIFLGFITLVACKEIIEPSIADKTVLLLAPSNNYESTQYQVSFWFEPIDDALLYRLQIVAPQFDSINRLIVDTLVSSNKFSLNVDPGTYQWRVRAENGSSRTSFSDPRSFSIYLSSISAQKVQPISPASNITLNQSSILFKWDRIFGASNYRLQIDTANFVDESKLYYNQPIPGNQSVVLFSIDKIYQWRVRAETTTEQSKWSDINLLTFDHTPPIKAILVSPSNNQQVFSPVNLQWNVVPTAKKYKLFVLRPDSTTLYDNSFPVTVNSNSYIFNKGSFNEKFYWKVSAIDEVGNEGGLSEVRSFTIK